MGKISFQEVLIHVTRNQYNWRLGTLFFCESNLNTVFFYKKKGIGFPDKTSQKLIKLNNNFVQLILTQQMAEWYQQWPSKYEEMGTLELVLCGHDLYIRSEIWSLICVVVFVNIRRRKPTSFLVFLLILLRDFHTALSYLLVFKSTFRRPLYLS